jgi:signal-transduction protein with cAMP-binding, CBS, and nucleotidyltransferase domain
LKETPVLDRPTGLRAPRGSASDILESKGRAIHAIGPKDTVYDAIARMCDMRVGALLVMEGDTLLGIVSERDYARKVILQGRASKETPVEEIMTSQVISVDPQASLAECMQIVTRHSIRHLPVVGDGRVAGVLSTGDLVRELLDQQAQTIHSLNSFIGSDYPT